MRYMIAIAAMLIAGSVGYALWPAISQTTPQVTVATAPHAPLVEVVVPDTLSQNARIGQVGYDAKCAACHGVNAAGQDGVAPPLVHIIYEPNHHGDQSFQRAAEMGVQAHHWPFGNMPPVEGITKADVTMITTYIRELQRANGIN